ncbi:IF1AX factor, partial [Pseudoatta argentina]
MIQTRKTQKTIDVAMQPKKKKDKSNKKPEPFEKKIVSAAEDVANALGGDKAKTTSDLLEKVLASRVTALKEEQESTYVDVLFKDIDLWNGKPSDIFENVNAALPNIPELKTWAALEQKELKTLTTCSPANIFQELILWTEQGKLWKFPIDNEQEYAQVTKMLGNGRLEAMCFDGVKRLCHIRGKLRKKVWINQGDIILIGLRDYQDAKADVILKYTSDEARNLKTYGEFPETVRINDTVTFVEDGFDEDIEFGDEISDDDEDDVDNVSFYIFFKIVYYIYIIL